MNVPLMKQFHWAANLGLMYTEWPLLERFQACADDGFEWAECLFPYEASAEELALRVQDSGVRLLQINAPPGDWQAGDRGLAVDPRRESEFRRSTATAVAYAQALGLQQMHVLAGTVPGLGWDKAPQQGPYWDQYRKNLDWLCTQTRELDLNWLIEPINRRDIPGYLLAYQEDAHTLIQELKHGNLGVQMDLYHCQIMEGDIVRKLERYIPQGLVRHIQIAGVPERHEPDLGELNLGRVLSCLKALHYTGAIGCEYRPKSGTRAGLAWLREPLF